MEKGAANHFLNGLKKGDKPVDKKDKLKIMALFFCCSLVFLAISSMTSFLYPMNNRVDQNCFLTVGKGILEGRVPYRDMFEQKGPVVYFLHAAALLIVPDSFIGVYIFQVFSMVVFLWYAFKIARLYLGERLSVIASLVTSTAIIVSHTFLRGDNVEEFCMPILLVGVYQLLRHIKFNKNGFLSWQILFLNGVFAGIVLWVKFTLLGFWGGWMLFVWYLIFLKRKKRVLSFSEMIKKVVSSSLVFLTGMAVTAIPWIIYFGYHGAIYDWIYTYFYANIFLYSRGYPLWFKPLFMLGTVVVNAVSNPLMAILFVLFFKGAGKCSKTTLFENPLEKKFLFFTAILLYIGLYIGMVLYRYYFLIVAPFSLFGMIYLLKKYEDKLNTVIDKLRGKALPLGLAVLLMMNLAGNNSIDFFLKDKKEYIQYQFAERIAQETPQGKTPLLLNANFIDGGFFFATNTMPPKETKYFSQVNIPDEALPEMALENRELIKKKIPDFVVTRTNINNRDDLLNFPEIYENYQKISDGVNKTDHYRYHLYKRKN